jgi:hypothetical protein
VKAKLDTHEYETGKKITNEQMQTVSNWKTIKVRFV